MGPHRVLVRSSNLIIRGRAIDGVHIRIASKHLLDPRPLVRLVFALIVNGKSFIGRPRVIASNNRCNGRAIQATAQAAAYRNVASHVQSDAVTKKSEETAFLIFKSSAKFFRRVEVPILFYR